MKIKPIAFSFAVSIILSFVFLMAIFWIIYVYSGDLTAIKDALNTTGSYFGGIATLAAAIIAAYLFNDWRQERKYLNKKEKAEKALNIIELMVDDLDMFGKSKFNDLMITNKLFYQLYGIINSLNLNGGTLGEYKTRHLKVANIIIPLLIEGNRELNQEERKIILYYRGTISSKLSEILERLINDV